MVDLFRVKGSRGKLSRNIPPTIKYDNGNRWIKKNSCEYFLFQEFLTYSILSSWSALRLLDLRCRVLATFVVDIAWEAADHLLAIFQSSFT